MLLNRKRNPGEPVRCIDSMMAFRIPPRFVPSFSRRLGPLFQPKQWDSCRSSSVAAAKFKGNSLWRNANRPTNQRVVFALQEQADSGEVQVDPQCITEFRWNWTMGKEAQLLEAAAAGNNIKVEVSVVYEHIQCYACFTRLTRGQKLMS